MEIDPFYAVTDSTSTPTKEKMNTSATDGTDKPALSEQIPRTPSVDKETPTKAQSNSSNATGASTPTPAKQQPTAPGSSPQAYTPNPSIDPLLQENAHLLSHNAILTAENSSLKDKIQKLKNLLGRSAKAQREAVADLATTKTKLCDANSAIDRLSARVEILENRPSHLELLADFETNFDRAVLALKGGDGDVDQIQLGGEETGGRFHNDEGDEFADPDDILGNSTLIQELSDSKTKVEHLEGVNAALLHRAAKLEKQLEELTTDRDDLLSKVSNLQLELRMAKMETQKATKSLKDKAVALAEMQMEIDMVTKASMDAIASASRSMEEAKTVRTSKVYVEELEAKVGALQEWALASAESKRLTMERAMDLEMKLKAIKAQYAQVEATAEEEDEEGDTDGPKERKLWSRGSSKIVGAGSLTTHIVELGECRLKENETVQLRWKFDLTPADLDIDFSVLKGKWGEFDRLDRADSLIRDRIVTGGAGGELSGAFAVQNSCTLVWSNKRSWVRPRSIKFSLEAFAIN